MTNPLLRMGAVLGAVTIALGAVAGLAASPAFADVAVDHLVLSPADTSITAGGLQEYQAEAFDADNNDLGDVTGDTTFSISADGTCEGVFCGSNTPGVYTVTGDDGGATGTASLTVNVGGLDHLVLSPDGASITAGGSQDYTAEGFDEAGNDLGDVTADTTFGITPDGSCTGTSCTATVAGAHTVTGTDGSATGTTSLTVDPSTLSALALTATPSSARPGTTVTITGEGSDQYGNDIGDKTSAMTVSISAGGSCVQNECFSNTPGFYTATGKIGSVTGTTTFHAGAHQHIVFPKPHRAHLAAATVSVAATATSGLPVTFTSTTPSICTTGGDDGSTITLLATGTCLIEADQGGDTATLAAAPVTKKLKIV